MPKIVFLDSFVLNPGDLDWGVLAEQGQLTVYERTPSAEVVAKTPRRCISRVASANQS